MMYNKLSNLGRLICLDGRFLTDVFNDFYQKWWFDDFISTKCTDEESELMYLKDLINLRIPCNFPILMYGYELQIAYSIAVVKVTQQNNTVSWEKLGFVSRNDSYQQNYRDSGIRNIDEWSDDDWILYGKDAYDLLENDRFFKNWVFANHDEEIYRRMWGFCHGYFNNDDNIIWVSDLDLNFSFDEYYCFFQKFLNDKR